ncbi:MAG: peptide/nickel transport system substrate-binding protein [Bacillota bacterium]|nr:MAG: peptide/nickel transport system substrate-binding protein [Bacillota bacterium]MBS3949235.1 M55 family metallopeptidase [Peptococcaceae bacterium]
MKVFISVDIEGVCGVVNSDSTGHGGKTYDEARKQMTDEVNAAVEGALAAGATEVVINDSHGGMNNILARDIHHQAQVILGTPKPMMMMEGIATDCDAAMFVGYHARMHSHGILSHTISGAVVSTVWVNDVICGEIGINAGLAGHFGIPVVFVTGDKHATEEAKSILGPIQVAAVKEAITRYSAKNMHPTKAVDLIRHQAEAALRQRGDVKPLVFGMPVTMRLEFLNAGMADAANFLPGSVRVDGRTVDYTADNYVTAFQGLRAMITLAGK